MHHWEERKFDLLVRESEKQLVKVAGYHKAHQGVAEIFRMWLYPGCWSQATLIVGPGGGSGGDDTGLDSTRSGFGENVPSDRLIALCHDYLGSHPFDCNYYSESKIKLSNCLVN